VDLGSSCSQIGGFKVQQFLSLVDKSLDISWTGYCDFGKEKMLLLTGIKFSVSYTKSVILAQNTYILDVCILCPGNECISFSVSITYRNYNF